MDSRGTRDNPGLDCYAAVAPSTGLATLACSAAPFERLHDGQQTWPFATVGVPPFDQGVLWSACQLSQSHSMSSQRVLTWQRLSSRSQMTLRCASVNTRLGSSGLRSGTVS